MLCIASVALATGGALIESIGNSTLSLSLGATTTQIVGRACLMEMSDSSPPTDGRIRAAWWYDLIWVFVFAFAAYGAYRYFVWFESTDESVMMWAPIAIIYRFTGKWGVVGVACLLSVICLTSSVSKFQARKLRQS